MNKVELLFQDKGILMHNTYVYRKDIAIDFIMECKKNRISILGIDAFIVEPNFHQPSQDNSIDFTTTKYSSDDQESVWNKAIAFLNDKDNMFYFEIVTP